MGLAGAAPKHDLPSFTSYAYGRTDDDDFLHSSDVVPGQYRLQADCGFGYSDPMPLESNASYQSETYGLDSWDEFDMFAETYATCDIRWGVYCDEVAEHQGFPVGP